MTSKSIVVTCVGPAAAAPAVLVEASTASERTGLMQTIDMVPAISGYVVPPVGCVASPRSPGCGCRGCIRTCCGTPSSPPCSTPAWILVMCRSQLDTRILVRRCVTTARGRTSTATPTTSWPPTWPPGPDVASAGRPSWGRAEGRGNAGSANLLWNYCGRDSHPRPELAADLRRVTAAVSRPPTRCRPLGPPAPCPSPRLRRPCRPPRRESRSCRCLRVRRARPRRRRP